MSTRLILVAPNGAPVEVRGRMVGMDLTEIPNGNASTPITLVIERECDMGTWHRIGSVPLPLYDPDHEPTT